MKIKSIKKVILDEPKQYYDVINADPYNNFLIKTNDKYICSHNCFVDEISFLKNKDVEEQKKKAKEMINTAKGGMKTRFIFNGKNPTLLCVASSKRSEQSFMETYIRELGEDDNVFIVDKPVWEVKPRGTYQSETFWVGLGNKYKENKVIPRSDYDKLRLYEEQGYQLLAVPIDFEKDARYDLNKVLCDYAGISSFSTNKFLSAERVKDVFLNDLRNPLPDIIECGNAKDDTSQYKDWFDISKLDKRYISKPLFIHLDMSVSGDKTGICGTWIIGKKATEDGVAGKDLVFQTAFSTSVKAPTGRQISFAKTREFIRWLKNEVHLKIKKITFDTFQSYDTGQQLQDEGFETEILSVDRVETPTGEKVGVCKPYQYLKNTIYEGRIRIYSRPIEDDETSLLYKELTQLEKNENTGKIDHPDNGKTGSKDQADALCGSVYTASKYASEYDFDYGENLEQIIELNSDANHQGLKQMTVDFEEQLKQLHWYNMPIEDDSNSKDQNSSFDEIMIF